MLVIVAQIRDLGADDNNLLRCEDKCAAYSFLVQRIKKHVNVCQVQIEVIQKRQKEKKAMMSAVKKYQKGDLIQFYSFLF